MNCNLFVIIPSRSLITDHHNKYTNSEKVWNSVRITKMWPRDVNAVGKMVLIDLLNSAFPENFLCKKHSIYKARESRFAVSVFLGWRVLLHVTMGHSFPVLYTILSVQPLSGVWLFATPWTAAHQASLSITISWSLLKLMSIESVMPSNHLILFYSTTPYPLWWAEHL